MGLPPEAIKELKTIYRKEYGKDLRDQEALAMGYRLATLGRIFIQHAARERDRDQV